MLNNKSFITVVLVFALVMSFGLTFWSYNSVSAKSGSDDQDATDDVDKVDVEKLPASMGKFQLKGVISAVNVSSSQISVNGLSINVASGAKIRKGNLQTFGDLVVDDRVEISGKVENGVLIADKIRVKGTKKILPAANGGIPTEVIIKLRDDIQKKIADILKRIDELQKRINEKLGPAVPPATTTSSVPTP